jgi:hypothetical protein
VQRKNSAGIEESETVLDVFCGMVGTRGLGVCSDKTVEDGATIPAGAQAVPKSGPTSQL